MQAKMSASEQVDARRRQEFVDAAVAQAFDELTDGREGPLWSWFLEEFLPVKRAQDSRLTMRALYKEAAAEWVAAWSDMEWTAWKLKQGYWQ